MAPAAHYPGLLWVVLTPLARKVLGCEDARGAKPACPTCAGGFAAVYIGRIVHFVMCIRVVELHIHRSHRPITTLYDSTVSRLCVSEGRRRGFHGALRIQTAPLELS